MRVAPPLVQRYAGDAWGDGKELIGAGFDPRLYSLEHSSVRSLADTFRYDCGELLVDASRQLAQLLADLLLVACSALPSLPT